MVGAFARILPAELAQARIRCTGLARTLRICKLRKRKCTKRKSGNPKGHPRESFAYLQIHE
jgi:hypothetical protein